LIDYQLLAFLLFCWLFYGHNQLDFEIGQHRHNNSFGAKSQILEENEKKMSVGLFDAH